MIWNFIKKTAQVVFKTIKDFITESVQNFEAIILLGLASIGASTILAEIPFHIALPILFESSMIIPVLSVLIVFVIAWELEWRILRKA